MVEYKNIFCYFMIGIVFGEIIVNGGVNVGDEVNKCYSIVIVDLQVLGMNMDNLGNNSFIVVVVFWCGNVIGFEVFNINQVWEMMFIVVFDLVLCVVFQVFFILVVFDMMVFFVF